MTALARWGRGTGVEDMLVGERRDGPVTTIESLRAREPETAGTDALHVVAWHRDLDGQLLSKHVAAGELLNVLRPTVAVARFITFTALALYQHPDSRPKLRAGGEEYLEMFVQEVRRFYPFFPFVAARVRRSSNGEATVFQKEQE